MVNVVSYTENLYFATPAGRAMAFLIWVFAEFERDLIRERVRAGLENARRNGKRPGRRKFFDITSLGTLGRLKDQGMSVRAIAREMKVSKSLVHKSLNNLNAQPRKIKGRKKRIRLPTNEVFDGRILHETTEYHRVEFTGSATILQGEGRRFESCSVYHLKEKGVWVFTEPFFLAFRLIYTIIYTIAKWIVTFYVNLYDGIN